MYNFFEFQSNGSNDSNLPSLWNCYDVDLLSLWNCYDVDLSSLWNCWNFKKLCHQDGIGVLLFLNAKFLTIANN